MHPSMAIPYFLAHYPSAFDLSKNTSLQISHSRKARSVACQLYLALPESKLLPKKQTYHHKEYDLVQSHNAYIRLHDSDIYT